MFALLKLMFSGLLLLYFPLCLAETTTPCHQTETSLQVLGSGGPEFDKDRASTSYLIRRRGEAFILIDSGSGSKIRFAQSGADFNEVRIMLYSHMHVDHSADFPAFIKSAFFSDRTKDLTIYGPSGNNIASSIGDFVRAMIGDNHGAYPYLSRYLSGEDDWRIRVNEVNVESRDVQNYGGADGIKLSSVPVHHGAIPALAWRVDIDNKSMVFSGDMNGDFHSLEILAKDADMLVAHHAIAENAEGIERSLHMPPSVIGKIAAQAHVKKLVLSHRMLRTMGKEKQSLELIQKHYTNPVVFANDLDCFVP